MIAFFTFFCLGQGAAHPRQNTVPLHASVPGRSHHSERQGGDVAMHSGRGR